MQEMFVAKSSDLTEGPRRMLPHGTCEIGVVRANGELRAFLNQCPHQCGPVCEGMMEMVNNTRALELTFEMINADPELLDASDYPHWDMDLPSTIRDLSFLSEDSKRNILGRNAQRVFNLGISHCFPTRVSGELEWPAA